jgi:hypothetical protein
MKLSRYGRLGVGVDVDNVSVAFGVSANLISGNLAYLENTNSEGNGLYIKTNSIFRNRYPLFIESAVGNIFTLTSDGFLGVGIEPSANNMLTVGGNAQMTGGYLTMGNSSTIASGITLNQGAQGGSTIMCNNNNLAISLSTASTVANPTISLWAGNDSVYSSVVINGGLGTITTNNLKIIANNTAKAWLHGAVSGGTVAVDNARSYNIQQVSRVRPGVYSIRLVTPMSNSTYVVAATVNSSNGNLNTMVNISSELVFVVVVRDNNNAERDPGVFYCVVYGI